MSETCMETTTEMVSQSDTSLISWFQCKPLTHAHALISSGLEAVVAETAIAALRIDTLAVAAHVGNVLALVPI